MNGNSAEITDFNLSSGLLPKEREGVSLCLLSGGCFLNNEAWRTIFLPCIYTNLNSGKMRNFKKLPKQDF